MESNVSINFLRAITLQLPGLPSRFFSDRPKIRGLSAAALLLLVLGNIFNFKKLLSTIPLSPLPDE